MKNNVLVIDKDKQNISYQKSSIDNSMSIKCDRLELQNTFNENPIQIFCLDTSNVLTIVDENNDEFSLHLIGKVKNPKFIRIYTKKYPRDNFSFNIAFENNHYISNDRMEYQKKYALNAGHKITNNIYDGSYAENQQILKNFNGKNIPAFIYCNNQKIQLNDITYNGYLPDTFEFHLLMDSGKIINFLFNKFEFDNINFSDEWWTSSEFDMVSAFGITEKFRNAVEMGIFKKQNYRRVLPIFYQIKK